MWVQLPLGLMLLMFFIFSSAIIILLASLGLFKQQEDLVQSLSLASIITLTLYYFFFFGGNFPQYESLLNDIHMIYIGVQIIMLFILIGMIFISCFLSKKTKNKCILALVEVLTLLYILNLIDKHFLLESSSLLMIILV
jgi:hypothetical protein